MNSSKCNKHRVMIVDDDAGVAKVLEMIVHQGLPDVHVDRASNGEEAVNLFMDGHQSVLIMDLHMPVMDGETAFNTIRNLCEKNSWEMPSVLFCTAYAPSDYVETVCSDNSRHCLLIKPPSPMDIIDLVRQRVEQAA